MIKHDKPINQTVKTRVAELLRRHHFVFVAKMVPNGQQKLELTRFRNVLKN